MATIQAGHYIISPSVTELEVSPSLHTSLLSIGYETCLDLTRVSKVYYDDDSKLVVSLETVSEIGTTFLIIKGESKEQVTNSHTLVFYNLFTSLLLNQYEWW